MPKPNYQIPTKLTFYPSHLQYYYAIGLLKSVYLKKGDDALVSTPEQARQEDLFKLAESGADPSLLKTYNQALNTMELDYNKIFKSAFANKLNDFYAALGWGQIPENNNLGKFFAFG